MEYVTIPCNPSIYEKGRTKQVVFLVLHYTANKGDTAVNNGNYFKNSATRTASAHYFVDEKTIVQSVKEEDTAWHCGGNLQGGSGHRYYNICTNSNSIGIELCLWDRHGNLRSGTVDTALVLVKELMKKYNIDKDHIIRHYDVTGKKCPAPWVTNESLFLAFRRRLEEGDEEEVTQEEFNQKMDIYLAELQKKEPSQWSEAARDWAEKNDLIAGDTKGQKQYKAFVTREQLCVFLDRFRKLL